MELPPLPQGAAGELRVDSEGFEGSPAGGSVHIREQAWKAPGFHWGKLWGKKGKSFCKYCWKSVSSSGLKQHQDSSENCIRWQLRSLGKSWSQAGKEAAKLQQEKNNPKQLVAIKFAKNIDNGTHPGRDEESPDIPERATRRKREVSKDKNRKRERKESPDIPERARRRKHEVSKDKKRKRDRKKSPDIPERATRRKQEVSKDKKLKRERKESPDIPERATRRKREVSKDKKRKRERKESPDIPERATRRKREVSKDKKRKRERKESPDIPERATRRKREVSKDKKWKRERKESPDIPECAFVIRVPQLTSNINAWCA